ncbi:MAG TPA: hypothetical protein VEO20_09240 [Thermoplasmata archaeon]|nr:hypothetical protein [Thermoplasmata archaeon]
MKSFNKAASIAILLSIVSLNLAFRYPTTEHEVGADSFVFHGLAQMIIDSKHAAWLINPLSLFGLYPLAHPSGPMLAVAAMTEVGGVPAEASILFFDFMSAILGALGAFLMAREIKPDPRLALLIAFLFSTAPRFVSSLEWQMPTRSLFTALVPVFVWALLRLRSRVDPVSLGVLATSLLLMMSAHRLAVVMAIVMAAYVAANIFMVSVKILRTTYAPVFLHRRFRAVLRLGSWCVIAIVVVYIILFSGVLGEYQQGQLVGGPNPIAQLENLGISLARTVGLLLPLVIVGVVAVSRTRAPDVREPWLVAVLVGIVPTLGLRQYTGWYLVPFAAIFMGLGILFVYQTMNARPRLRSAFLVCMIAGSIASSAAIVNYERSVESHLTSEVYDGGLYLRAVVRGPFLSNSGSLGVQSHAISGLPYLPIGGSTTAFQGPEILAFGYLQPGDVHARLIPIGSLTIEDDSFFVLDGVNFEVIWADILSRPANDPYVAGQLSLYNIQYYLETRGLAGSFEAYGNTYASPFAVSVASGRYVIYETGDVAIYFLQSPRS